MRSHQSTGPSAQFEVLGVTKEQILAAIEKYNQLLSHQGVPVLEHPHDVSCVTRAGALTHLRSMFPEIYLFLDQGKTEKAFRWLGFVQGALWALGLMTIEQLRNDNRSDPP